MSNTKEQQQQQKRSADCIVCLESLRLPYTFNCGHGLCVQCTAEVLVQNQSCPSCRAPITSATPNYLLMSILELDTTVTDEDKSYQLIIKTIIEERGFTNMQSMRDALPSATTTTTSGARIPGLLSRITTDSLRVSSENQRMAESLTADTVAMSQDMDRLLNSVRGVQQQQTTQTTLVRRGIQQPLSAEAQLRLLLDEDRANTANNNLTATRPTIAIPETYGGYHTNTIGAWIHQNRYANWLTGYVLLVVIIKLVRPQPHIITELKGQSRSKVESKCYYHLKYITPDNFNNELVMEWVWSDMLTKHGSSNVTGSNNNNTTIDPNNNTVAGSNNTYSYNEALLEWLDFNLMKWLTRDLNVKRNSSVVLKNAMLGMDFSKQTLAGMADA